MKKVLGLAGVLLAVVLFAALYQFKPIGQLDFNAYVLGDDTVPANLKKAEADEDALLVTADRFEIFSPLYELAGEMYVGENKEKPNPNLPIFANDGSALMLVNSNAKLVDIEFSRLTTFRGQFVSNGAAYNPDRTRSDPNTIILVALSGGIYSNALDTTIEDTDIPMNSVLCFSEDEITYYEMVDGTFFYKKIVNLTEDSVILMGDELEMGYHEFLRKLGLMRDLNKPEEEVEEEQDERLPIINDALPAFSNVPWEAPKVSLSSFKPYVNEGFARARLHVSDVSASINTNITIYIKSLNDDYSSTYTLPLSQFSGRQTLSVDVDFPGLILGYDYEVYGEYSYVDGYGVTQYVRFGDQVFRFEPKDRPTTVQNYVKPTATIDLPLGSSTYHITGKQTVKDPAGRILGGIRYDITRLSAAPLVGNMTVYARKYVGGSGEFALGMLPPGEQYHVRAYMIYLDAYNQQVTEELFELDNHGVIDETHNVNYHGVDVWTKGLDQLTPIKLNFENGQHYPSRLSLDKVYFDTTVSPYSVDSVYRVDLNVVAEDDPNTQEDESLRNGTSSRLAGSTISALKKGEPTTIQTANSLSANTTYSYSFKVYDPFGNELQVLAPTSGTTWTCKAPPTAQLKTTLNIVGRTTISASVQDTHDALTDTPNIAFVLHDLDGNLVSWYPYPYIRGTSSQVSKSSIDYPDILQNSAVIDIAGLRLATTFRASIVADYDIADGQGIQYKKVIGSTLFTTPSVQTLGSLVLDSQMQIGYPTESAASFSTFANLVRTNIMLIELLDNVTFAIYVKDDPNKTVVQSISFTRDDLTDPESEAEKAFAKLVAGDYNDPAIVAYLGLPSMTEFVIDTRAQIRIIEDLYDVNVSNTITGFKTLRKAAVGVIPQYSLIGFTDSIYIFGTYVNDPDEAVVNGRVTMRITDVGKIEENGTVTAGLNNVVALEPLNARTSTNNVPGQNFVVRGLETNHRYKIEYIAAEYNVGYDYSTYQTNVTLDTFGDDEQNGYRTPEEIADRCYYVDTTDSLSGRLSLVGMDAIPDDDAHLLTSIKTEIVDRLPTKLSSNPSYSLKIYKRPGYGDYILDTDNFTGGMITRSLGAPRQEYEDSVSEELSYFYEYRVELWVMVGTNEIMLDQLEFDTDGPMILIGPNYANALRSDGTPNYANDLRMLQDPQPWGPNNTLIGG